MPSKCVLVVDDEPNVLKIVGRRLTAMGYEVMTASSGEDALKKAFARRPDLVLLDLLMPGMDGAEVCSRLKENAKTETVPVIMLTAAGMGDAETRGLKSGVLAVFNKPFLTDAFETIKNVLEGKKDYWTEQEE
ncbi:MAG TPA: response regulator [Candidatus Omnitrophota bacterium]|nr:response regulator [Candidatus Omnitrophota bacterium]